jgi:NAD(P)H-dependent FMN reductase
MYTKKKILAICGSTKHSSSNLRLIHAMAALVSDRMEFTVFNRIDTIPHFNPDLDTEEVPVNVIEFRTLLRNADGILICTPEYAMGVPGSLKNAMDWTVSSMEFSGKPVALITAATSGEKAHQSMMATLNVIEAEITDATQLLIPFINTRINQAAEIADPGTLKAVLKLLEAFEALVNNHLLAENGNG